MFQNLNNVLFNRSLSLKCNCCMKGETQMHFNVNRALLNNNMHKNISIISKPWCDT